MTKPHHDRAMDLLARYVHASGSLQELSEAYGVRGGTRGIRVDRLIDHIRSQGGSPSESPFERTLRVKYLYGKIARPVLKELMNAYREFLRGAV